ncbi:hypothetical protein EJ063_07640 [Vibrio aquaticus]|uniref:Uncharacterized protein n=1 Tax=Vibrio aquaticus TaxID=2496559 RepID=A0A432CZM2_9VIBR|nr:hypothetical protein [Vibrio aquaticus]RTZ16657.1 hypothetical protein EJ063_07640 [Vibrio aquaticus]
MWFIEFIGGKFNNLQLPIDEYLTLSGKESSENDNVLLLPEILANDTNLEFKIESGVINLYGLKKKNKAKKIKSNFIYNAHGLKFFVYFSGDRNPKESVSKFKAMMPFFCIFMSLTVLTHFQVNNYLLSKRSEKLASSFSLFNGGYFSDGVLKLPSSEAFLYLSEPAKAMSEVSKSSHDRIKNLYISVISSFDNENVEYEKVELADFTQIIVNDNRAENIVMEALGSRGITFKLVGDTWLVSDYQAASDVIEFKGVSLNGKKLKESHNFIEHIDREAFFYSIFYSSTSESYIFDDKRKYWIGSEVPLFGTIQEILDDKIVFKSGKINRVYNYDIGESE